MSMSIDHLAAVANSELTQPQGGPCLPVSERLSHECACIQVGRPYPEFHETEDERKNRLSDQRILDARRRLCPGN